MKQALVEGAVRLPQLNMHEQGNGRINLPASQAILANYTPRASLIPPAIHFADCPYMWPHCKQPLYAHALPVVLNATVVNGMANMGYFAGPPVYEGLDEGGKMLHVMFKYSDVLWPWSGYLAVYVQVGYQRSSAVYHEHIAYIEAFGRRVGHLLDDHHRM
jgi:membrane-bound transcription factor site-1 protease